MRMNFPNFKWRNCHFCNRGVKVLWELWMEDEIRRCSQAYSQVLHPWWDKADGPRLFPPSPSPVARKVHQSKEKQSKQSKAKHITRELQRSPPLIRMAASWQGPDTHSSGLSLWERHRGSEILGWSWPFSVLLDALWDHPGHLKKSTKTSLGMAYLSVDGFDIEHT